MATSKAPISSQAWKRVMPAILSCVGRQLPVPPPLIFASANSDGPALGWANLLSEEPDSKKALLKFSQMISMANTPAAAWTQP